jgi:hypothetical protein
MREVICGLGFNSDYLTVSVYGDFLCFISHYAVMPAQLRHPLNRNLVLEDYVFHCLI